MHKKLDLFFYGEPGVYDVWSPAYVGQMPYVPEILYLIAAAEPFAVGVSDLIKALNEAQENEVISSLQHLLRLTMIEEQAGKYKLGFPVFLEADFEVLKPLIDVASMQAVEQLSVCMPDLDRQVMQLKHYADFPKQRWLYHMICDTVFDGMAFDYFESKGYFSASKDQPNHRDYIVYGFENSPVVAGYSDGLLCSSNNYRVGGYTFNSFGDGNGQRKDLFRFMRSVEKTMAKASPWEALNLQYIKLQALHHQAIAADCGILIDRVMANNLFYTDLSQSDRITADFLMEMHYIVSDNGRLSCAVPVFETGDMGQLESIGQIVLDLVDASFKQMMIAYGHTASASTSLRHGVSMSDISVELWHQLFGGINEALVARGLVSQPSNMPGEGRYMRSFVRSNDNG